jgi:hypothetical protein
LTLDLILKYGGFEQGMDRAARTADKRMKEIEARALKFGKFLGGAIAAGATAAAAGLFAVTKEAIDFADHLNDLKERLGISAEALSGWAYAAKQSGTDIDALGVGLKKLAKNMAEALDPKSQQAGIFKALGVEVKDANGNLRSLEDVLPEVAQKFKEMDNATTETALAMELFGKSGADLLEFLNQGQDGIEELRSKARELGVELSDNTLTAADEFNDRLADLKTLGLAAGVQLADKLLPAITDLVNEFRDGVKDGGAFGEIIKWIGDQAQAAVTDFKQLKSDLEDFKAIFNGFAAQAESVFRVLKNIATLDFSGAKKSLLELLVAREDTFAALGKDRSQFANVTSGSSSYDPRKDKALFVPENPEDVEGRVNRALGGGSDSKKKKSGKSDAQREAEQLKAAYDRMNESLAQQVALFGQDGMAAQVRYEIEHGELVKLSQAEKDSLIAKAEKLDMLRAESEVQKALDETNKRRQEAATQVLEDIQSERDLLGQTIEFQDTYNKLKRAGVDANSAFGQSIIENNHALHEEAKAISRQVELMDTFRTEASNALADVVSGTKSLSDAFKDMFDNIADRITQMIADRWIEQLFGEMGSTGGGTSGGGWIAAIAGLFGGGKASGGWTSPNTMYEVNERGFEMASVRGRDYMLTGSSPVHITPNHQIAGAGGGVSLNQTFVVQGTPDRRTREQMARESGREAARGIARTGR